MGAACVCVLTTPPHRGCIYPGAAHLSGARWVYQGPRRFTALPQEGDRALSRVCPGLSCSARCKTQDPRTGFAALSPAPWACIILLPVLWQVPASSCQRHNWGLWGLCLSVSRKRHSAGSRVLKFSPARWALHSLMSWGQGLHSWPRGPHGCPITLRPPSVWPQVSLPKVLAFSFASWASHCARAVLPRCQSLRAWPR